MSSTSGHKRKRVEFQVADGGAGAPPIRKFEPVSATSVVPVDDIESDDVQVFLIRCPAELDVSALDGVKLPAGALRSKRARLDNGYEVAPVKGDAEAAQIRLILPAPDAAADVETLPETYRTRNMRVARKEFAGVLTVSATGAARPALAAGASAAAAPPTGSAIGASFGAGSLLALPLEPRALVVQKPHLNLYRFVPIGSDPHATHNHVYGSDAPPAGASAAAAAGGSSSSSGGKSRGRKASSAAADAPATPAGGEGRDKKEKKEKRDKSEKKEKKEKKDRKDRE